VLPCKGTCNQNIDFEVLIKAPKGYTISETEYGGAATWNSDQLKCIYEPCVLQAPNPCFLQSDLPEGSYPVYGVRLFGKISLLVSISPVQNQYGQGNASISKWYKIRINQIVYYTTDHKCCFDFSEIKLKNLTVKPHRKNTFIINGTLSLVPEPPDAPVYAFIANKNDSTVSVIDTSTMTVQQIIDLPYEPIKIEVTPDKAYTFVLHSNNSTVSIIRNETLTITATLQIAKPFDIGFSPDNHFAYILHTNSISVIDISTQTIFNNISLTGSGFSSIAIDPNGQYAYIVNAIAWSILKVDLGTGQIIVEKPTGGDYPSFIEISQLDGLAYVVEEVPPVVTTIGVYDLSNFQSISGIFTGSLYNSFLSLSPVQPVALLGNQATDEINIIDTIQRESTGTISINSPASAAFTPDGNFIYIAQPEQNTVTILNSGDYTVITVVQVGASPISISI
jgi:YVTN family beta-propeller protein